MMSPPFDEQNGPVTNSVGHCEFDGNGDRDDMCKQTFIMYTSVAFSCTPFHLLHSRLYNLVSFEQVRHSADKHSCYDHMELK